MYRGTDAYEGRGARIYRDAGAVLDDIISVREGIDSIKERLNLRQLLPGLFSEPNGISELIPQLEGALFEAEDSLFRLRELEARLEELKGELYDIRCVHAH